ncbi:hypothetical protein PG995_008873 [Apiospora arundinis]
MTQTNTATEEVKPTSKLVGRFYEPLFLLEALNVAARDTAIDGTPEDYTSYIYKLAHVCDNKKGGTTVTSFMALRGDDGADSLSTASQRQSPAHGQSTAQRQSPHDVLLRDVLQFNTPRLVPYMRNLNSRLQECLDRCANSSAEDETLIADFIKRIQSALKHDPTTLRAHDRKLVVELSESVIRELNMVHGSPASISITERAREGRMPGYRSQECWSDLQHTMSRIRAYSQSIVYFLDAQRKWPSLFEEFKVSFIPSSAPASPVTRPKSATAEGIVGRMTNEPIEMEIFKNYVRTLQDFNLDERIQANYRKQPIVHSEVLLLDWLSKTGAVDPRRFFNDWMYIGASKPTCRLCHYYFESYNTVVERRPSHNNIYNNWRVPDPLSSQGIEAIKARDDMMGRVLERIRRDAFALVMQRVPSSVKKSVAPLPPRMITNAPFSSPILSCNMVVEASTDMALRNDSNTFSAPKTFRDDGPTGDAGIGGIASSLNRVKLI